METPAPTPAAGGFTTTRWTMVVSARGDGEEARTALAELCGIYWAPVCRFLRGEGRDDDRARELTQEFFARILAGGGLGGADRGQGRFRSYLLGAVKHFLADVRDHERRLKRGGGAMPLSLDAAGPAGEETDSSSAPPGLPVNPPPPDGLFDRQWAVAVMNRALAEVEAEYRAAGRGVQFDACRPWLGGEEDPGGQAQTARRLGLGEGALRVAIHRLRRRFRDQIRREIEQTVSSPDDVDAELRYLVEVLSDDGPA